MPVHLFGIWSDRLFRSQIDAASATRSADMPMTVAQGVPIVGPNTERDYDKDKAIARWNPANCVSARCP
jgi:hypothetical protein